MASRIRTKFGRRLNRIFASMIVATASIRGVTAIAKPACEDLAGSVVFQDTLYGTATGVLLGGLYLLASQDHQHTGEKMATFGLGGAGLGIGAGALELGFRDCQAGSERERRFVARFASIGRSPALQVGSSW